ncbi:hypothetical protein [Porphyromonas gulae]|uniref:hypothetical protein n=1 Tax=Porphyromonas gulae TaxID=111105 RepID=UPI0026F351B9|nr:hypothetical protein [Porphyromonas gulae]
MNNTKRDLNHQPIKTKRHNPLPGFHPKFISVLLLITGVSCPDFFSQNESGIKKLCIFVPKQEIKNNTIGYGNQKIA